MELLIWTFGSLAVTGAVAWPGSSVVVRYVTQRRPDLAASPRRLRRRVVLWSLLCHVLVLGGLLLDYTGLKLLPEADLRLVLALLGSPVAMLVTLACVCDALCLRLPNILLGLAAVPVVLLHLARAFAMVSEARDPCTWSFEPAECRDQYAGWQASPADYLPVIQPLALAATLTLATALAARLSRQVGAGDVKLVALLTFTVAPFTPFGHVYALLAGLAAAGLVTGLRVALGRADRHTLVPLGPYLLGAFALTWCAGI